MTSVAAVGECMLELSGGDDEQWRMGFAGDTFNTLWTMRALLPEAAVTDYVSAFGDDPFSQRQMDFFAAHGIGTAESPVIAGGRPGLYAITLAGAERSFTYWRAEAAARRLADDEEQLAASLRGKDLVYFSGITLAILEDAARQRLIRALAQARKGGAQVAFDPNYRARLWPSISAAKDATAAALAVSDIALPTFLDEAELFGDADEAAAIARIAASGVGEIAIKNGPEAASVTVDGETVYVPATPVAAPLDTTGAGDGFNGAYLAARLAGATPADAARQAHDVAATVVQARGALAPFERLRVAFNSRGGRS